MIASPAPSVPASSAPATSAPAMSAVTPVQAATLAAISRFIAREGKPPTVRELTEERGSRSLSGTWLALRALESRGHISLADKKRRGIQIIAP